MVILEEGDPGIFDRGTPTKKLVHQLSSTGDPIFSLRIPANRIVGGYNVKDGVLHPRHSHSEVIEAVFRRTRVTVGVMTAAKLLSAVEPIIRYRRGSSAELRQQHQESVRYQMGLQAHEDALHRLVDVWRRAKQAHRSRLPPHVRLTNWTRWSTKSRNSGEAGCYRPSRPSQSSKASCRRSRAAAEIAGNGQSKGTSRSDPILRFLVLDSPADTLCPAAKLWNTG